MPDLGAYRTEVLAAYAGTIVLLVLLIGVSIWQARRVARHLHQVEARRREAAQSAAAEDLE